MNGVLRNDLSITIYLDVKTITESPTYFFTIDN